MDISTVKCISVGIGMRFMQYSKKCFFLPDVLERSWT